MTIEYISIYIDKVSKLPELGMIKMRNENILSYVIATNKFITFEDPSEHNELFYNTEEEFINMINQIKLLKML